jgi:hypothetical protein
MEISSFAGFSVTPPHQDHLAAVGRILDSDGLATIFAGLKFAGLLYRQRFSGESPGHASCQLDALRQPMAVE